MTSEDGRLCGNKLSTITVVGPVGNGLGRQNARTARTWMDTANGITMLGWSDYVGLIRCRAVPSHRLEACLENGLGWAVAGQALTPFSDIAPNPWGPSTEVRQVPDPSAHVSLPAYDGRAPFDLYLCDSRHPDGSAWECCTRDFSRRALAALEADFGLRFVGAFEHEFTLVTDTITPAPPFSVAALRVAPRFTADLADALSQAGLEPETVEAEYGELQYELTTSPATGLAAADRAILTRDVIREVARWHGLRATFSPKPTPNGVGNGAHLHFSFADAGGTNVTRDPLTASQASPFAESFIAGVLAHMPALVAYTSPSPVSFLRLGPHHWSCGFASFGIENREAAIRICPSPATDPERAARGFNLEYRPGDATASPYMIVGALVQAGLSGVRRGLPLPPACPGDPADLSEAERLALGIVPLPASLTEALAALEADAIARSWMPELMRISYGSLKRLEQELADAQSPEELCRRHATAY